MGSCWNLYRPNPQAKVFFAQMIWHRTSNPAVSRASEIPVATDEAWQTYSETPGFDNRAIGSERILQELLELVTATFGRPESSADPPCTPHNPRCKAGQ